MEIYIIFLFHTIIKDDIQNGSMITEALTDNLIL